MTSPLIVLYEFQESSHPSSIPGYFAVSTAPDNVEDREYPDPLGHAGSLNGIAIPVKPPQTILNQIATQLTAANQTSDTAELVIAIHGYNMDLTGVKRWNQEVWRYVNHQIPVNNAVFLGYRWPAERVSFSGKSIRNALSALPIALGIFLIAGIAAIVLLILTQSWLITLFGSVGIFLANLTITLMILRITGYFRDVYRATHFGVPDLVELIRQIDKAVSDQQAKTGDRQNRIKLSFIAHSMGGFVTTGVVRILSDAFDVDAIGEVDCSGKAPSSEIGTAFCLGRLVMVSPDIPSSAILLGRANFLKSSLRRFEEAYLFSSEGDLALRIASTAANYFSYPTSSRQWGHRLGNVTVRPLVHSKDPAYGIVNGAELAQDPLAVQLLRYLEINTLTQPVSMMQLQQTVSKRDEESIANLFTYFDCTDYLDLKAGGSSNAPVKLLSYRLDRGTIANAISYVRLLIAWLSKKIDVHGGYFQGQFARDVIYKLAFLGLQNYLKLLPESLNYGNPERSLRVSSEQEVSSLALLQKFSDLCADKKIQVAFSPERYIVDILGEPRRETRQQMLNAPVSPEMCE
jgi:hypothetical protein